MLARDVVWEVALGVPDVDGVYRGRAAVRRFWKTWMADFAEFRLEVEELIDAGERVFAAIRPEARGRRSGIEVTGGMTFPVFTVRDGLIVHYQLFADREQALEAAGLSEQATSQENVEVVRSLYELGAVNPLRAPPDLLDRVFRDYADEGLEIRLPSDYPEGEPVFRGREGIAEMQAMLRDTWGAWRIEPDRFFDSGDHVVVYVRIIAEGGASGVPIELEGAHVWTVRGGRAKSMHAFRDRSQALGAAGMEA